ncbi:hypothetical protein ONO86_02822 [Micromonospora noduli]|nr:hypothetical protein ONO86_02822 [Micromonospora noduli]
MAALLAPPSVTSRRSAYGPQRTGPDHKLAGWFTASRSVEYDLHRNSGPAVGTRHILRRSPSATPQQPATNPRLQSGHRPPYRLLAIPPAPRRVHFSGRRATWALITSSGCAANIALDIGGDRWSALRRRSTPPRARAPTWRQTHRQDHRNARNTTALLWSGQTEHGGRRDLGRMRLPHRRCGRFDPRDPLAGVSPTKGNEGDDLRRWLESTGTPAQRQRTSTQTSSPKLAISPSTPQPRSAAERRSLIECVVDLVVHGVAAADELASRHLCWSRTVAAPVAGRGFEPLKLSRRSYSAPMPRL